MCMDATALSSREALRSAVGSHSEKKKRKKKKNPLFWASVINSLFCGRINMHIYCSYIVHFCILVFHFIVIAVFASMREISFLDRFKVTT